jgi:hypothetical protein
VSLKFCSMNYSSKVDEYNKQVHGIEKKDYSELVERLASIKIGCVDRAGEWQTNVVYSFIS